MKVSIDITCITYYSLFSVQTEAGNFGGWMQTGISTTFITWSHKEAMEVWSRSG